MNAPSKSLLAAALIAASVGALPAVAGPDTYGLGTGKDGPLTVSTVGAIVNVYAQVTAPVAPGDTSLVVGSSAGLAAGDLVLLIQMTGIVPEPPSSGPTPVDLGSGPVGHWELARLASVSGTTLTLDVAASSSYAASVTQVIRVPEYTTVTVNAGRSLVASAFNGSTGGVVAFLANGTFTNNGSVSATGKGFRGGLAVDDSSGSQGCTGLDEPAASGGQKGEGVAVSRFGPAQTGRGRVANGGGGGVCLESGGGGGGNGGAGGQGGNSDLNADGNRAVGGEGGAALTFGLLDHALMGGGGGAGHVTSGTGMPGGAGGGIVFIRADALAGAGALTASGAAGGTTSGQDAASGGGGGGTLLLRVRGAAACGALQAIGGIGGSATGGLDIGPGGGGGGGRILFQKGSGTCAPAGSSVNGASPGVQADSSAPGGGQYGAQVGSAGSVTTLPDGFPAMAAPVLVTPADGSSTGNRPTISGTLALSSPSGTEVVVLVDGAEQGRVTPDASGNWTFTLPVALAEGSHTVQTFAIAGAQGVQSVNSATRGFTVDTTPPPAPVAITPADGTITQDSTPTYSGTAEASSTLAVIVDGTVAGTTTANASGSWSFTQPTALADGAHTVKARATDAAGNTSTDSTANAFTVDTTPPPAPVALTPADGTITQDSTPTCSGTAEASSTVTVIVDGTVAGTTTANASGSWSFTQPTALADGAHTVRARATDAAGNTSSDSTANAFTVDTAPPALVGVPSDTVVEADSASGRVVSFASPTAQDVQDGAVAVSCVPTSGSLFPFGATQVACTAQDAAGNSASASFQLTVQDTTPPALSCPAAITVQAETAAGAHVSFTLPTATDAVTAAPTVLALPDSGSLFAIGTTQVTVSATDGVGNSTSCSFAVEVTALPEPVADAGQPQADAGVDAGAPDEDAGVPAADAGSDLSDAGTNGLPPGQPGCGCSSGASGETVLMGFGALAALFARRRRRANPRG